MHRFSSRAVLLAGAVLSSCLAVAASADPVRFFALGDLPYSRPEVAVMQELLSEAVAGGASFIVHVGDIKSGGSPCTDSNLQEIAGIFRSVSVPVVYTPGDNEWTDCHRRSAGGFDPIERLRRVREVFFADPGVLRRDALDGVEQNPDYPENFAFRLGETTFVALHVVGSRNGLEADRPEMDAEFQARDAADRAFLRRAVEKAKLENDRAIVVIFHADALFHRSGPRGFEAIKRDFRTLADEFDGPVLVLHGDTHRFVHDRPFRDPRTGEPIENLIRVEVPGSPIVGGVWISVDPEADEPFAVEPVYWSPRSAFDD